MDDAALAKHIEGLDWNRSKEEQDACAQYLAENIKSDLRAVILPNIGKPSWANAAKVIALQDIDKILPHLPEILVWLQDLNWPGAREIFDYVKRNANEDVIALLAKQIDGARSMNDEIWIDNLTSLLQAIESGK